MTREVLPDRFDGNAAGPRPELNISSARQDSSMGHSACHGFTRIAGSWPGSTVLLALALAEC